MGSHFCKCLDPPSRSSRSTLPNCSLCGEPHNYPHNEKYCDDSNKNFTPRYYD